MKHRIALTKQETELAVKYLSNDKFSYNERIEKLYRRIESIHRVTTLYYGKIIHVVLENAVINQVTVPHRVIRYAKNKYGIKFNNLPVSEKKNETKKFFDEMKRGYEKELVNNLRSATGVVGIGNKHIGSEFNKAEVVADQVKRSLIIPDCHIPHHDGRSWLLMMKIAKSFHFDRLIILGDFLDLYSVSSHDKSPARQDNIKRDIEVANELLDELDTVNIPVKHFIHGNHENRLNRYIAGKCPELFGMLDLDSLLKLKERGYTVTKYHDYVKVDNINFMHDHGLAGKYAVIRTRESFEESIVIGHIHSVGIYHNRSVDGGTRTGASFGWLGDFSKIDYLKSAQMRNWHHGIGIGYTGPDGLMHLQAVPFINGRAIVEGKLFRLDF